MPDGRKPEPGGWNRIIIDVDDLAGEVARLRNSKLQFRNDIVNGPGGSEILLDDVLGKPDRTLPTQQKLDPSLC
jgi:hypothetical protein